MSLVYTSMGLMALTGFCSFAVDWGRVQLAKAELQHAADAAARQAVVGMQHGEEAARDYAARAAADNTADGRAVVLDRNEDIEFGDWDVQAKKFKKKDGKTVTTGETIRVTARRTVARGNAVPMVFASLLGKSTSDVTAVSVATTVRRKDGVTKVGATANPWLAGMPPNTLANVGNLANNPDVAPQQSPAEVHGVKLKAGEQLSFDSIAGNAKHGSNQLATGPDGNTSKVVSNFLGAEHGKSNLTAPINAVVGVFLSDSQPNLLGSTPASLDFSTPASRDFTALAPPLRQVFFIGDGRTAAGEIQKFTIPAGATRLFIGTMDGYEWNNNVGEYVVTIYQEGAVAVIR